MQLHASAGHVLLSGDQGSVQQTSGSTTSLLAAPHFTTILSVSLLFALVLLAYWSFKRRACLSFVRQQSEDERRPLLTTPPMHAHAPWPVAMPIAPPPVNRREIDASAQHEMP